MWFVYLMVLVSCVSLNHGKLYDHYTAKPVCKKLYEYYQQNGALENCTIDIQPCDENERRRVDGTCNNLKLIARGTHFEPMPRILPAHYYNGSEPRKAKSGKDLTLPRVVRTTVLNLGKSIHKKLNQNVPAYGIFSFVDAGSIHDIEEFLFNRPNCCANRNDNECTVNIIPDDDPVHRFDGIRCLNMTRPLTYQHFKCTKDPVPAPIMKATTSYDLSQIYNVYNEGADKIRSFIKGQLAVEEKDGKIFPPSGPRGLCPLNEGKESLCYENYLNSLLPQNLFTIWFVRHHNYLAKNLAAVNPCWDDETLFQVARDMNIASAQQIYVYEWLSAVIGRSYLRKAGILASSSGFRDIYDEEMYPLITLEHSYSLRWFHTIQEPTSKLYDKNGKFVKEVPMFNLTMRTGWVGEDNNLAYMTQSMFRQPCHNADHSIDYDVGERGNPHIQQALDIATSDLHKARLFGMAPYIDYVKFCSAIEITCFEDLEQIMSVDMINKLKLVYDDVEDIDLIAGLWSENLIKGGNIPQTLACIISDSTLKAIKGDRHWYERKNRPHAFTRAQLSEIRKLTMARFLCTVGDDVSEIQKDAFFNINPNNPLICCDEFEKFNFKVWKDSSCRKNKKH